MSQQVLREERPSCFGRVDDPSKSVEGWDPTSPVCKGGLDPTYTHPTNGTRNRDRCAYFNACGIVAQAKKQESTQALIDPKTLLRPQAPMTLHPSGAPQQQQQQQQQSGQVPQFLKSFAHQMLTQRGEAPPAAAHYGYQQMMPVNYQMPAYLTNPEPIEQGGFWKMFARTIFRSMGKSVGHSIAYLFDTVPLASINTSSKPGSGV